MSGNFNKECYTKFGTMGHIYFLKKKNMEGQIYFWKKNMEVLIKICYWMKKKYLSADVNDKYIGSDVFRSVL